MRDNLMLKSAERCLKEGLKNLAAERAGQLFQKFLDTTDELLIFKMRHLFLALDCSTHVTSSIQTIANQGNLKALKTKLLATIFAIPDREEKINALLTCLLRDSFIGQILYTPRHFSVSLNSGALGEVVNNLKRILADEQPMDYMSEDLRRRFQCYPDLIKAVEEKIPAFARASASVLSNRRCGLFWDSCMPYSELHVLDGDEEEDGYICN